MTDKNGLCLIGFFAWIVGNYACCCCGMEMMFEIVLGVFWMLNGDE
jgi:hypothetical protein